MIDKKVIQSLFTNVCAKDELRPIMAGVHFESERCYCSDGHVLVIYNESKKSLDGKTMTATGEIIEGRYPNVDAVFPREEDYGMMFTIDIRQLRAACQWQQRQEDADENDHVVINSVSYNIPTLARLCNVLLLDTDPSKIKFYNSDPTKATIVVGTKIKGLIMPTLYEEVNVDAEREFGGSIKTYSYENLINEYVFNSWKKPQKPSPLAWLD